MQKHDKIEGHLGHKAKDFITDELPQIGEKVEVVGTVGGNTQSISLLCAWSNEGWVLAGTRRLVDFDVVGWRRIGI